MTASTPEADRAGQADHAGQADRAGGGLGAVLRRGPDSAEAEDRAEAENHAETDRTGDTGRAAVARSGSSADRSEGSDAGETPAGQRTAPSPHPLDDEVTVVPGVARYHRRGCILIRFLSDGDLEVVTRREAEATGSVPCKACQPDKPDPSA